MTVQQIDLAEIYCGRCGERVSKLHYYEPLNMWACADCCTEEQEIDHEANSQFGVGA